MDAEAFLADAHAHGHRGPALLKRWAIRLNTDRRQITPVVTTATLNEAVELEDESMSMEGATD